MRAGGRQTSLCPARHISTALHTRGEAGRGKAGGQKSQSLFQTISLLQGMQVPQAQARQLEYQLLKILSKGVVQLPSMLPYMLLFLLAVPQRRSLAGTRRQLRSEGLRAGQRSGHAPGRQPAWTGGSCQPSMHQTGLSWRASLPAAAAGGASRPQASATPTAYAIKHGYHKQMHVQVLPLQALHRSSACWTEQGMQKQAQLQAITAGPAPTLLHCLSRALRAQAGLDRACPNCIARQSAYHQEAGQRC